MENLYDEIASFDDVSGIVRVIIDEGDQQVSLPIEWFLQQAKRIDYDPSFGGEVINPSLKIVFANGSWLERHEYDGSEWFEHKSIPKPDGVKDSYSIFDLFRSGNDCPFNPTLLDGISINAPFHFKPYCMWKERDGSIVLEPTQYEESGKWQEEHTAANEEQRRLFKDKYGSLEFVRTTGDTPHDHT